MAKLQSGSKRISSRLTANDAQVGGSLEVGRFRDTVTTDAYLLLPNLTTTERNALTAEQGMHVYDTTLGYDMVYRNAGWGQTGGSAAGSLDAAYNGGAAITVDAGAVTLNDAITTTQGTLLITKSGAITGATNASVFHINSTGAHDSSGTVKMLEISVGTETVSGAIIGTEIAMNANTDNGILVTKGAMTLSGGAVVLTSGNLTVSSGTFTMTSGAFTYTAGDMTMSDGSLAITDADNANTLTIVNNSCTTADLVDISSTGSTTGALMKLNANAATHDGEVLEIISAGDTTSTPVGVSVTIDSPTTGAARGIEVTMAAATTTAKGIVVTMDALTTGDMLYLDNGGASMTGDGKFINCNDDNVSLFSVAANGLTTIAGSASGTDALVITAGDILLSSGLLDMTLGDFTMADGSVSITDADNAATLTVVNNTATTTNSIVDISSTSITTGALMTLNANTTAHDGEILELINAGDATSTGTGLSVTMPDITTGAATGISVVMVGATTTAKGISVTMDAITAGDMLYLDAGGGTLNGGFYINCNDDNVSDFSVANGGATVIAGVAAGTASLTQSLGDLVITDTDSTSIDSVNGTGDIVTITGGGVTAAGKAMLVVTSTGAIADGAFYVDITSGANGASSTDSYLLHVDAAHTQIEAIHVDAGNVLFDEGLTVVGTLTQTGAATFTAGQQSAAVARTATADGLTTGTVADGTTYVTVTGGANENAIIILPTPTPGNVVWLGGSATGYELRSSAPGTVAINGGTSTAAESHIATGALVRAVCTSATTWVCSEFAPAGTEAPVDVAAT